MSGDRFVRTPAIQAAVRGHETEVLTALGINPRGRAHITCPFPDHEDANPSWRWDERRARAHCTCANGHALSIFDVLGRVEAIDFDGAKIRAAELIGRADLIEEKEASAGQKMNAESLLAPPAGKAAPTLPRAYLAHRLGVALELAPMPVTPTAGWATLPYWDPPAEKGGKPRLVAEPPCAVFGTIAPDGRTHAHRIYVQPAGAGKADLEGRDPKKSATLAKGASARGCAVLWGDRESATWCIVCEGIETAAAIAFAFKAEIEVGYLYVAAAISEAGVGSFEPWPATAKVTVCADRDEAKRKSESGYKAGEKAARKFAARYHDKLEVVIAIPGDPGGKVDFLDALLRDGADALRAAIFSAETGGAPADEETPAAAAGDERVEVKLSALHFNAIARRCAQGLSDIVYMRGPIARVLARAETAGGRQVEDRDGEAVEIGGVRYRPGSLLFLDATSEIVSWHLDERFTFWKFDQRRDEWVAVPCPPRVAARVVGSATELGFRPCSGFVRVPLFIKGKIISAPGWHGPTGLIVDVHEALPAIPDKPNKETALEALARLLRPFRGYLRHNPKLRSTLAAAALTAALRPSLPTAPAILIDGNVIGAGKGKVARALAVLATDGLPAIIVEGHNDEETEKRVATAVLQGASALLFDNLQRTVASSALESMLTEGVATVRIFGRLADVTVECRALVLMTANNATLRRDMLRRTLPVRIVVPEEKPELRRFDFDPVDEARRDRPELLAAAFTVVRAWYAARGLAENAKIREKTLGSFELWAELVAGAVEWLTGESPVDAVEARKNEDPAAVAERVMITALYESFDDEFTAPEAASRIDPATWRMVLTFKGDHPEARAVGKWLQKRLDQAFSIAQDAGNPPVLVTVRQLGADRKGYMRWTLKGAEFAEFAEFVSPSSRALAEDLDSEKSGQLGGAVGGKNGSASFQSQGQSNSANSANSALGECAFCHHPIDPTSGHTATSSGEFLHNACVDLWVRQ